MNEKYNDDDEYEEDFQIEMINNKKNKRYTINHHNWYRCDKYILCHSYINKTVCRYGNDCTYANNLEEQIIDEDKMSIYAIMFDEKMTDYLNLGLVKQQQVYNKIKFYTKVCTSCAEFQCVGGYNCRNGAMNNCIKICRTDFLTGDCKKNHIIIEKDLILLKKLNCTPPETYHGCENGHHLTTRGFKPFHQFTFQNELNNVNMYKSKRIINDNFLCDVFLSTINSDKALDDDDTTDEDLDLILMSEQND